MNEASTTTAITLAAATDDELLSKVAVLKAATGEVAVAASSQVSRIAEDDDDESARCDRVASGGKAEEDECKRMMMTEEKEQRTMGDGNQVTQNQVINQAAEAGCCAGCREPIRDKFIFSVIDLFWHQNCVQCCDCSLKLNERCYTYEGKLYCKLDYWRRYGPKCYACREPIERSELVQRIKGNRVYHLKCFTCNECQKPLKAGEQLHLIDGKRLLCKQDYHQHQLQRGHQGGPKLGIGGDHHHQQQTYYTLLSSQQQQEEASNGKLVSGGRQFGSGGEEEVYEELGGRHSAASNPAANSDECGVRDDELEESGDESLDNMRRLLRGYDNNNLENEENNHSALRFGHHLHGAHHHNYHHHHHHHHHHQNLNHQHLNQNHLHTNLGEEEKDETDEKKAGVTLVKSQSTAAAAKRKRRRKQKQQQQQQFGGLSSAEAQNQAKKLASRDGESILNGNAPAGSILATAAASLQQQQHPLPKNLSPSASTASNSSSSSSSASLQQHQAQAQAHQGHLGPQHLGHQSMGGGGGGSHKPTRVRTVLNEKQLQTLREVYAANPRPDALMKEQLVDRTGLSPRVIRVWFQNKRCKDKKKSILYKQMQQHEKDGRHLAGLTLMRGVPMVATSPIHYDDQSTVSSTPGHAPAPATDQPPESQPATSPRHQRLEQQQPAARHYAQEQADIQAYQPPWKSLIEYAAAANGAAHPRGATPPNPVAASNERVDAASPHYQHLMGQIHGYGAASGNEQPEAADGVMGAFVPPQAQQSEQAYHQMQQQQHHHHHLHQPQPQPQQQQQQQQHHQPLSLQAPTLGHHQQHLHQFQR